VYILKTTQENERHRTAPQRNASTMNQLLVSTSSVVWHFCERWFTCSALGTTCSRSKITKHNHEPAIKLILLCCSSAKQWVFICQVPTYHAC